MNSQEPIQTEEDEISLIDILLFLQASFGNVVKSLVFCLLAGGAYYFFVPKMYEASTTIVMATVAGEPVESPAVLLEKMKLPLYFSPATLQACGLDSGFSSRAKFFDKIKPSVSKSAPMVSFVTQAPSPEKAKACLSAVIAEASNNQDHIAKPLLKQKKQKLNQLSAQLEIAEEVGKSLPLNRINNNLTDTKSQAFNSTTTLRKINVAEINDLRSQIISLESQLIEPKTHPIYMVASVYSSEDSVNKWPLFTLGLCLVQGVFLGLLVTGVMRMTPGIRRQMRDAESRAR